MIIKYLFVSWTYDVAQNLNTSPDAPWNFSLKFRTPLKLTFLSLAVIFDFHIKMDTLTDEFLHICAYLSDKDNIYLSDASKRLSIIKFRILFFTKVYIKDIIYLSYFHQFTNVTMSYTNESLPKHISCLAFGHDFDKPINGCIPESVTNLTFGYFF